MMKPSIPKGTRDFLPKEVQRRRFIFDTIESVFKKYGYLPIETPTMEALDTLTGKYGEEGDKLLFKVLNNGDYLAKADKDALESKNSQKLTSSISKRGLRYDLTVPFARYVVMHQNDLAFPFKRYQIQPVWRADRPQKGRYQEFYQCDVDVVGSDSLMYEAELMQIYLEVFKALKINVTVKLNNRKILLGIAEQADIAAQFMDMTIAIDKLDKIGQDGVTKELLSKDIRQESIDIIFDLLATTDFTEFSSKITSESGKKGIEEMQQCYDYMGVESADISFTPTLARGLNYYTGCIVEVAANDVKMGSIGGGGRYDDLTGVFGMKDMSGVGISFGAARIYDVMTELELFDDQVDANIKVIVLAMDDACHRYGYNIVKKLRQANIASDMYPEPVKMKKQMKYANAKAVPYVIVIGSQEMETGIVTLKDMESGNQQTLDVDGVIDFLK